MRSLYGSATAFLKKHLLLRAAVLLALLLAAAFAADRFCTARPDIAEMLSEQFEQAVEQSGAVDEEAGTIRLIPLFVQNFRATALMTLLGFIPFLFIPRAADPVKRRVSRGNDRVPGSAWRFGVAHAAARRSSARYF